MAKMIFVGHEASRSGAPYIQLYILRWLKANTSHTVELVLLKGGELVPEFEKVANVYVINKGHNPTSLKLRIANRIDSYTGYSFNKLIKLLKSDDNAFVYANSLLSLDFALELNSKLNLPFILHLHEYKWISFLPETEKKFIKNAQSINYFIACSSAVKEFYQNLCSLPDSRIGTVYSFSGLRPGDTSTAADVRQELALPAGTHIVGAVGSMGWGKGTDIFLRIAQDFKNKGYLDTHFVWVGGNPNSVDYFEFMHDIEQMDLADMVTCVKSRGDIQGFYEAFDVLLLTSRMDSFPLVCLEAATHRKPVICFAGAGGIPEFVQNDAGFVIPYADSQQMGDKLRILLNDRALREQMGLVGERRVQSHHTINTIGPQIYQVLQQFLPADVHLGGAS